MTSTITPSKPQQRAPQMSPPQQPHHHHHHAHPGSPPSKRDLKSWWKSFQTRAKHQETQDIQPKGIFGVPLRQSITYANVAISLVDEKGKSYIYGYVPIVVAKCGVFLKEKATGIEGIFRLSGSEKRIKELKLQFDSPDRYGKGLVWDGYTVHDAANVLRRYLNDLPEPVVPLDLYERFRDPLRGHTKQAVGDNEGTQLVEDFNEVEAIEKYQQLIKDLPPLNRQLLLYILDLLAVFAAKADENRMTAQNLAAIFQPGMLSHPQHAMAPEEYRLNQCVIIFLIENQDHFLIGMQGTATDEKTKQEIEKGPPTVVTPATPSRSTGVVRSASNASAGAESVSRDGKIRRNRSTSSRHSLQSNGASTPGSPALTPNSGLARSNTVPSKKSPHIPSGRFPSRQSSPTVAVAPASPSPAGPTAGPPPTVAEEAPVAPERSPATSQHLTPMSAGSQPAVRSQERLLGPPSEFATPLKERNLQSLFQRTPGSAEGERRQPNKLRKKRLASSTNPSAQSSTASLPHSEAVSPAVDPSSNPIEYKTHLDPTISENGTSVETPSEPTPRASQVPSQVQSRVSSQVPSQAPSASTTQVDQEHINSLKPKSSPSTSLHSSFNEGSDADQVEENLSAPSATDNAEKEKKRRWRISRRKEDMPGAHTPPQNLGNNSNAEMSTSSVGSGQRPRKSWTGDSSDVAATLAEYEAGNREKEEPKGPLGWIKNKYREAKENVEIKRTKSPPREPGQGFLYPGGKSVDTMGSIDEKGAQTTPNPTQTVSPTPELISTTAPHDIPLPSSPPPTQATHNERPSST
ncbi:RhoGAP-domain-containing protein [Annulohypoxylon maeteangense]|uniref:RhoGAP-domain-containing protein n=1 Tax=Annulohypoxylon maeteangense TaxID=1927788 RepID=UPI0020084F4F|nr:RhoGAP-domain-containing protein [Annulohypoxylon maeteangense]KAI0887494.1 RhoGAP-domain-containing protein [Annulohypoxylon maeteangense]